MAPPPVTIYVTSLTSAPKVRKHTDLLRRSLNGLEIPYEEFDLVMDEEAKKKWQRSKPPGVVVGLPGYLVGGEWVGTMEEFEDAVETQTLESFLKQDIDLSRSTNTNQAGQAGEKGENLDSSLPSQKSIQEVELEKLMREMTDDDLDKLMGELGVEEDLNIGKIGLLSKSEVDENRTSQMPKDDNRITDVKETDKGLLQNLKSELSLDEREDKFLENIKQEDSFVQLHNERSTETPNPTENEDTGGGTAQHGQQKEDTNSIVPKGGLGQGEGDNLTGTKDESEIVKELKKELLTDQREEHDIDDIITKKKID
ncbi:uncharacterized protein IL334_004329 [Kwoniella shivajii]|uniref:Glutaredoxin domain-containing protein n=1 Tax=Kwoniella shivajii TaxID=564305 RepID=A0ABZ1D019_9TREE|nr:hypothetical protein IL334_004329 [Kwoniella shivajii]